MKKQFGGGTNIMDLFDDGPSLADLDNPEHQKP